MPETRWRAPSNYNNGLYRGYIGIMEKITIMGYMGDTLGKLLNHQAAIAKALKTWRSMWCLTCGIIRCCCCLFGQLLPAEGPFRHDGRPSIPNPCCASTQEFSLTLREAGYETGATESIRFCASLRKKTVK